MAKRVLVFIKKKKDTEKNVPLTLHVYEKLTLIPDLCAVQTWTLFTPQFHLKIAQSWFTRG